MKKTVIMKTFAVASLVMAVSAFPAFAQSNTDTQALNNRLNQLENQMQTLTRHAYKGDVPPPDFEAPAANTNAAISTFETRVGDLEEEVRNLTGQVEKLQYDLSKTTERLDAFEAHAAQAAAQASTPRTPISDGQGSTPPLSNGGSSGNSNSDVNDPENMDPFNNPQNALPVGADATTTYEHAYNLIKESNYAGAEKAFSSFISKYPNDKLITNARYWLAETFYVRGNFETAAIKFAEAYQKDQKGPKAADNLLKLGMSLGGLGKKDDACLSLKELDKRFPDASASVKQRATQQKSAFGCS